MATYTGTQHSSSRRQLVVVGLAALAVGLAVGLGVSKVDLHRHRSSQVGAARPVAAAGGRISRADAMGGAAEFLRDQPQVQPAGGEASSVPATTSSGTTAGSTASLYLVGSAAQANDVQQRLDQVRAAIWFQPLDATVMVVGPEASADEVTWLRTTLNEARRVQGLAPLTVVDLRTAEASAVPQQSPLLIPADQGHAGTVGAAGMPGQPAAVSGLGSYADVPMSQRYTVYLVSSPAEVDAVLDTLSPDGPPRDTTVLLVTGAASEAQAQETIARQNTMRSLVGLAPLTVVDLRTPATGMPPTANATGAVPGAVSPPTTESASAVATSSTVVQARQAIADENQLRASLGLPELPDVP
jgi:hypothetical protein